MTEYVLLHPDGDEITLYVAAVDRPMLMPKTDAPRLLKRLALERQLAELDAEEGITPTQPYMTAVEVGDDPFPPVRAGDVVPDESARRYAGSFTGADGVRRTELHFSEQKAGPQNVCECSQSFYDRAAFLRHSASCGVHQRFVAHPAFEPGALVQGSAEEKFVR